MCPENIESGQLPISLLKRSNMSAPIRVMYSDTTYDVVVGENLETHKIVAAVIDYNTYEHNDEHPNNHQDPNILYIPKTAFIEINLENPAHAIPIIKHAPVITEIAEHPSPVLTIISPCYNVFYLIQKMVPNKRLIWQQYLQTNHLQRQSSTPIIEINTASVQNYSSKTSSSTVITIAKSILATLQPSNTPCNIEYVNMSDPDFAEHIRHSPTRTRFFKVCSFSKL